MTKTSKTESPKTSLTLREFCDRISVKYRDARYVLAHGMIPDGIDEEPGRGNHRTFNYRHSFWLAIVLKLKAARIQPKLAADMAKWAERVKGFALNLGWDWNFSPFDGKFPTENKWYLEVGDAQLVRLLTDANPSCEGVTDESGWVQMKSGKRQGNAAPTVIVRVDLSRLSNQLYEATQS